MAVIIVKRVRPRRVFVVAFGFSLLAVEAGVELNNNTALRLQLVAALHILGAIHGKVCAQPMLQMVKLTTMAMAMPMVAMPMMPVMVSLTVVLLFFVMLHAVASHVIMGMAMAMPMVAMPMMPVMVSLTVVFLFFAMLHAVARLVIRRLSGDGKRPGENGGYAKANSESLNSADGAVLH